MSPKSMMRDPSLKLCHRAQAAIVIEPPSGTQVKCAQSSAPSNVTPVPTLTTASFINVACMVPTLSLQLSLDEALVVNQPDRHVVAGTRVGQHAPTRRWSTACAVWSYVPQLTRVRIYPALICHTRPSISCRQLGWKSSSNSCVVVVTSLLACVAAPSHRIRHSIGIKMWG